jgi:hypothetical protein
MVRRTLALVCLLLAGAAIIGARDDQDTRPLEAAERLHDYLDRYEARLGALVAEERFEQTFRQQGYRRRRVLVSDVGFLRLPGDQEWVGHRSVRQVDRRLVRVEALSLTEVLQKSGEDLRVQARLLSHQSAPFNLGHARTVNVPTLPLDLLHRRRAPSYTVSFEGTTRMLGREAARLLFTERGTGSIVAFDAGSYVKANVRAWVDLGDGAVLRADVRFIPPKPSTAQHRIRVDFGVEATLGLLVPVRLHETFRANGDFEGRAD